MTIDAYRARLDGELVERVLERVRAKHGQTMSAPECLEVALRAWLDGDGVAAKEDADVAT